MHGAPLQAVLEGVCNRCGNCCSYLHDGVRVYCEHLLRLESLGTPYATRCRIHDQRTPNMPIRMLDDTGVEITSSICAMGSAEETWAILTRGMGKGCSLNLVIKAPPSPIADINNKG